MSSRRASFQSLAVETIQHIGILAATTPLLGPPQGIVPLLSTSRTLYRYLNFHEHPHIYASIFRIQFDTAALHRRFGPSVINAHGLSLELRRRWMCLGRIRAASEAGEGVWGNLKRGVYSQVMLREDMMTAYLMLLESDGWNAIQLLRWARLPMYLAKYRDNVVDQLQEEPIMPVDAEETSLFVWLTWFCLDYRKTLEGAHGLGVFLTSYVFGTFAYDGFHAPWPYHHLPLPSSSSLPSLPSIMPQGGQQATLSPASNVFTVDNSLTPRPVSNAIRQYFGRDLEIAVPLTSQAATLAFVACNTQYPFYIHGVVTPSAQDLVASIPSTSFTSVSNIMNDDLLILNKNSYTAPYMQTRFATITNSQAYDDEWKRLITCRNPVTPQLYKDLGAPRYRFTKGTLSGEWDGRFIKTQFETYRRIMEGETAINVLEEASVHHDNHSWRIEEHYFNRTATASLPSSCGSPSPPRPLSPGSPLNAHLPCPATSLRPSSIWSGKRGLRGIIAPSSSGQEVYYQTWDTKHTDGDDLDEEEDEDTVDIIITGHSINRPKEIPAGHHWSMPPGSSLVGTIRKWDGLITLRADSAADSWLWRGYVVGNGDSSNWVGRYRVAHMDVSQYGYEGVFTLAKRL